MNSLEIPPHRWVYQSSPFAIHIWALGKVDTLNAEESSVYSKVKKMLPEAFESTQGSLGQRKREILARKQPTLQHRSSIYGHTTQQLYKAWWKILRSFSQSKTAHGITPDGTHSEYRLTNGLAATNSSQSISNLTTIRDSSQKIIRDSSLIVRDSKKRARTPQLSTCLHNLVRRILALSRPHDHTGSGEVLCLSQAWTLCTELPRCSPTHQPLEQGKAVHALHR